jgi:hypothetical protein
MNWTGFREGASNSSARIRAVKIIIVLVKCTRSWSGVLTGELNTTQSFCHRLLTYIDIDNFSELKPKRIVLLLVVVFFKGVDIPCNENRCNTPKDQYP